MEGVVTSTAAAALAGMLYAAHKGIRRIWPNADWTVSVVVSILLIVAVSILVPWLTGG